MDWLMELWIKENNVNAKLKNNELNEINKKYKSLIKI